MVEVFFNYHQVLALPWLARAQDKSLRMLVGYPPGGAVDVVAREVAEGMRASGYTCVSLTNASDNEDMPLAMKKLAHDSGFFRRFPDRFVGWEPRLRQMIPSFGRELSADPAAAEASLTETAQVLELTA